MKSVGFISRVIVIVLFSFFLSVQGDLPGFKTSLTQEGVNYLASVGVPVLEQKLANLQIPDITGDVDTPIGHCDYQLTGIHITSISWPSVSVKILPGAGFNVELSNLACSLTLNWHYRKNKWPHIHGTGTADVSVSEGSANIGAIVTVQSQQPFVTVQSDSVSIGDLHIKIHGGASWLYDLFVKMLSKHIKSAVQNALSNAIKDGIASGLNKVLATLPISEPVSKEMEIDFPLVDNPYFGSSFFVLPQLGEFYEINNHQEAPFPRRPLPDTSSSQMVEMVLSDFVVASAGYVQYKLGKLQVSLSDKNIPSWSPVRLNTTSFKYIIPELYELYPGDMMEVKIYCTQAPEIAFTSEGANINATGNLDLSVILSNQSVVPVLGLNGTVSINGQAILSGSRIYGNLSYISTQFGVAWSDIGNIGDLQFLNSLINLLLSSGILPAINAEISNGFNLPTVKGVTLVNPSLHWAEGYVMISTDITYVPSFSTSILIQ